eukprot:420031-Heterocapsa_arctica.AAC.1
MLWVSTKRARIHKNTPYGLSGCEIDHGMRGTPLCTALLRGLHNLFASQPGAVKQAEDTFSKGFGPSAASASDWIPAAGSGEARGLTEGPPHTSTLPLSDGPLAHELPGDLLLVRHIWLLIWGLTSLGCSKEVHLYGSSASTHSAMAIAAGHDTMLREWQWASPGGIP